MFIRVKLLQGFQEPLLYQVPDSWETQPQVGSLVRVPLRNKEIVGLVQEVHQQKPETTFALRNALRIEPFPVDKNFIAFIDRLARYYTLEPLDLIKRLRSFLTQKEQDKKEVIFLDDQDYQEPLLTVEQQTVVDAVIAQLDRQDFAANLLHGVTGSGKTEVYKALIKHAYRNDKSTLFLLPEVSLAVQFFNVLRTQLPQEIVICGFHSAVSVKEKRLLWQRLLDGKPTVIVGVHLPVMLPIANLGLILVDEEHEVGYQEKKHPKINTKEAAIMRALMYKIPIVLGSATPTFSSLYNVQHRGWNFFQLTKRFAGAFPEMVTVKLNDKKKRKNFWISDKLYAEIQACLQRNEQVILFLNRRGYSFFVQCKSCEYVFECGNCSVSLTLHDNNMLLCHYCGFSQVSPTSCAKCNAAEDQLLKKGIGTQQVVAILQKLFPSAVIGRADMDSTVNKKNWQQTMKDFSSGKMQILVGTQTITKGYHFPGVTLVGILWADLNLHMPLYNAAETTLQQLIQVAGRAGRVRTGSKVIVQTMIDHPVFQFLNELDYLKFYESQMRMREIVGYPPCIRLAQIEFKGHDEILLDQEIDHACSLLQQLIAEQKVELHLLGPVKPPVHKIKSEFSRKLYLKAQQSHLLEQLFFLLQKQQYVSSIFYTPNPLS